MISADQQFCHCLLRFVVFISILRTVKYKCILYHQRFINTCICTFSQNFKFLVSKQSLGVSFCPTSLSEQYKHDHVKCSTQQDVTCLQTALNCLKDCCLICVNPISNAGIQVIILTRMLNQPPKHPKRHTTV